MRGTNATHAHAHVSSSPAPRLTQSSNNPSRSPGNPGRPDDCGANRGEAKDSRSLPRQRPAFGKGGVQWGGGGGEGAERNREMASSFSRLHESLQLHCLTFLNHKDLCRVMLTSKAMLYLAVGLQLQVKEFVTSFCDDEAQSMEKVLHAAMDKMSSRPQFGIAFSDQDVSEVSVELEKLTAAERLPRGLRLIGAKATTQVAFANTISASDSNIGVQLGAFPEAISLTLFFDADFFVAVDAEMRRGGSYERLFETRLAQLDALVPEGAESASFWRGFVMLSSMPPYTDTLVTLLQRKCPSSTITGGICETSWEFSDGRFREAPEGCVVLCFGGDVPLRSCVSNGLESASDPVFAKTGAWIPDSEFLTISEFATSPAPEAPVIRPMEVVGSWNLVNRSESRICVRFPGESGFAACARASMSANPEKMLLAGLPKEKTIPGAEVRVFCQTARGVVSDLDNILKRLRRAVDRTGDEVLGASMISCLARGPGKQANFPSAMLDATTFAKHFPNVPLLGFYGGGEIGPLARALDEGDELDSGNACVQGFTVVFGLFIRPKQRGLTMQMFSGSTHSDPVRQRIDRFLAGQDSSLF